MDGIDFAGGTGAYTGRPDRFATYCFFVKKFSSVEEIAVVNKINRERSERNLKEL